MLVRYGSAFLTADQVSVNQQSGEVIADGNVRIQSEEQIWAGEHIRYNFKTRQMEAEQFRTGKTPVFVAGEGLHGDYHQPGAMSPPTRVITTDDVSEPAIKVRAKYIKIIPGDKVEAHHATLYVAGVPVFYFPYYSRNLGPRANNFNFVPGYRTSFGPFLLSSYNFFLSDAARRHGARGLPRAARRGSGAGFELSLRPLGRRDLQVLLPARPGSGRGRGRSEHQQESAAGRFLLPGQSGHQLERQGASCATRATPTSSGNSSKANTARTRSRAPTSR